MIRRPNAASSRTKDDIRRVRSNIAELERAVGEELHRLQNTVFDHEDRLSDIEKAQRRRKVSRP